TNNPQTETKILYSTETHLKIISNISKISLQDIKHKNQIFSQLQIDGYAYNKDYGYPQLPVLHKLIEVPFEAEFKIKVISFVKETFQINEDETAKKIFPAQPSLSKSDDPDKVPFHFEEWFYKYDDFNNTPLVDADILGVMRGVQTGRLNIKPVRYNPVKNIIEVYNNLIIEIEFVNPNLSRTYVEKNKYASPLFNKNLKQLINYEEPSTKDLITTYPVKYVIVADPMFQTALQPFVQWKTRKGFKVIQAYTDNPAVGNTTTTIKTYLQGLYTSATTEDPAPSYILFVGDVAQVPAFQMSGHVTDLYYSTYDGTSDYIPDVYYGRFSASTVPDLQSQIEKTLEYEQYLFPDPAFLNEVVMVSGVDAGNAPTYGNGQINYGTEMYFNAAHGLLSHTYLYPASQSSAALIISDVSKGVAFANYTAHGGSDGWVDPAFTNNDVAGLTNASKYPLMIGNCCQTNKFEVATCFGEALLRAQNKGAIGYIGASNNSYWSEDYWWGTGAKTVTVNPTYDATKLGAYDCLFHENGEPESSWYITGGQIIYSGNLAVAQGGGATQYYWEIYHLMGDPSLMVYLSVPPSLTISHASALPVGISSLDVITEPYAYVAISLNNVLLDAKLAGSSGLVQLNFPAFSSPCTADVVATKQNRKPYIGTLNIIPANAPFVSYLSHTLNDAAGNNNQLADFGENIQLNLNLKNVGMQNATGVTALLSTADTNVIISDNTHTYGNFTAGESIAGNNAYAFQVKSLIEDQHIVIFNLTITDNNSNTWNSTFTVTLNAPKLKIMSYTVHDNTGNNNGRLDAGENAIVRLNIKNEGHAAVDITEAMLSTSNPDVSVLTSPIYVGSITPNQNLNVDMNVSISPNASTGSYANFNFFAEAGLYDASKAFTLPIGLIAEDWESNTFTYFPWNNTGTLPWILVTDTVYEGVYAAKSAVINHQQESNLIININVLSPDTISFFRKVSSEASYDFLRFYVDNVKLDEWSGELDWEQVKFPIITGNHSLRWTYAKDYSYSEGSDCARIDLIMFPPISNPLKITTNNISDKNWLKVFPSLIKDKAEFIYSINLNSDVSLKIYNNLGQEIFSIVKEKQTAGTYQLSKVFDLPSGVYFASLEINSGKYIQKIIITK
ncbi:MAG: hypothetical protein A2309_14890, partial [Bacteroidetes bacterium RIFOXYB2_FULL_35_7]